MRMMVSVAALLVACAPAPPSTDPAPSQIESIATAEWRLIVYGKPGLNSPPAVFAMTDSANKTTCYWATTGTFSCVPR